MFALKHEVALKHYAAIVISIAHCGSTATTFVLPPYQAATPPITKGNARLPETMHLHLFELSRGRLYHPGREAATGLDVLIDADCKPWLIEAQRKPAMSGSALVRRINGQMFRTIFEMSCIHAFDDSIAAQLDQLQVPLRGRNLRQSLCATHGVLREYRVLIRRGKQPHVRDVLPGSQRPSNYIDAI